MIVTNASTNSAIELSLEDFFLLQDLIENRSGIHLERSLWDSLRSNVSIRIAQRNFTGFKEYYNCLLTNGGEEEFQELLNTITVHETYFFRDPWQFDFIKTNIIPEIIQKKIGSRLKRVLKIWSAGCSTGEEPYSIAMTLLELKELLMDFKLEILATDVSTKALKKAKEGIYGKNSFRNTERRYLEKYFTLSGGNYHLHEEVKNMVNFSLLNLVNDPFPIEDMRGHDIILCKNVIIYFRPDSAREVLHNLYQCLAEKGYLFTGAAESLFHLSHAFQLQEKENVFYYIKEKHPAESGERVDRKHLGKILLTTPLPKISPPSPKPISRECTKTDPVREEDPISASLRHIGGGEYEKAKEILNLILNDNTNYTEASVLLSYVYICLGKLEDALSICHDLLEADPLSVEGHLLSGLIYKDKEETDKALMEFKKAIYLQPNLALAHYYLGELYLANGNKVNAAKEYKNALTVFTHGMGQEKNVLNSVYSKTELRQILYICQQNLKPLAKG